MSVVQDEPIVSIAVIVGAVVAIAGVFGVGIDADTLTTVLAAVAPLVAALIGRNYVSPV